MIVNIEFQRMTSIKLNLDVKVMLKMSRKRGNLGVNESEVIFWQTNSSKNFGKTSRAKLLQKTS